MIKMTFSPIWSDNGPTPKNFRPSNKNSNTRHEKSQFELLVVTAQEAPNTL